MRTGTVSYKLEDLKKGVIIPIGFVGENDFTKVFFDAEEIYKKYPSASVSMKVQPPKGGIYPATVTKDGNTVIWQVKEADVANRGGGELQLTFTDGETKIKTYIAKTDVKRSLEGNGPAPDPVQGWVDNAEEVLDDLAAMDNIAKTAEAGDIGKALSPKTVENGVVTEWQYVEPGAGTEDYTDLENKPQIGGVELSGDMSLHDLGIAAESAIPDVSGKTNLSVVAPAFDQATANDAGSLVTYTDGVVYVLPEGHTAGTTWANTQKNATNIAEQQRLLKNHIHQLDDDKYEKPSGGIPSTDMTQAVQDSLSSADSAYQKPSSGIPASDIAEGVIPPVDSELSDNSTNAVQNKVVKGALDTKAPVIINTATGNPAVFNDGGGMPIKSLLIPFTPKQEGSENPSPQNIRSILPWDGLTVYQSGADTSNPNETDISFPSTVYGGTLDVVSGVLTERRYQNVKYKWSEGRSATVVGNVERRGFIVPSQAKTESELDADITARFCSVAPWKYNYSSDDVHYYGGGYTFYVFLPVGTDENLEIQLVVERTAQPQEITLTIEQITALKGENTIWSTGNSDMTVEYPADTELFIANQHRNFIAPELSSMKADTALTANDFRIVGNNLYKITSAIASGGTLTPNTNCVKTTLAEVIKPLLT